MEAPDARGEQVPAALHEAITRELKPVRPLASPWRRVVILVPVAALVLIGVPRFMGLREDAAVLGPALLWGLSAVQVLLGVVLVGLALRESVPGRALSGRALAGSIGAAVGLMAVVTAASFASSPTLAHAGMGAFFFRFCLRHSLLVAVPLVLAAGFLAARAWPLRPWAAGTLYGLGAGLMADAGWRLFCEVSAPSHVLPAHGGAVLASTLAGIVLAHAGERIRTLRFRRSGAASPPGTSSSARDRADGR